MWNYAYFMIALKEQDRDDDDGLELFVRKCIGTHNVEWFPKKQAMCFGAHVRLPFHFSRLTNLQVFIRVC